MYAKINSTTWTLDRPATSCVAGTDGEYAFEFEHELGCPMQGSTQDCTCYVSRIRLVKTPVGRTIPTTEPDLRTESRYWERRAKLWRDRNRKAERALFAVAGVSLFSAALNAAFIMVTF